MSGGDGGTVETVDAWAAWMDAAHPSSAAGVVVGDALDGDLAALTVELRHNGTPVATGTGHDAMGHPHQALAWLRDELAARGETPREGDLVITGGLTRAVPLAPGDVVEARFPGTTVAVRR